MGPGLPQLRPTFISFRSCSPGNHADRDHALDWFLVDWFVNDSLDLIGRHIPGGIGCALLLGYFGRHIDRNIYGRAGSVRF